MPVEILRLKVKPPFNLDLTMKATEPAAPTIYVNGTLSRAIRVSSGKLIPVEVRQIGDVENPKIEINFLIEVNFKDKTEIVEILKRFLCTNDDITEAYEIMREDKSISWIEEELYGVRPWTSLNPYESLIDAIIFQQISLRAAFSMIKSLVRKLGDYIEVYGKIYRDFPTPKRLAESSIEELHSCKLSRNKAMYIKGIANRVLSGFDFESLAEMSIEKAISKLMEFKGVGRWTAEIVLATGFKRWDVVPVDDLGIRRAISRFYFGGKEVSRNDIHRIISNWGENAWIISYYLLVACERLEKLKARKI